MCLGFEFHYFLLEHATREQGMEMDAWGNNHCIYGHVHRIRMAWVERDHGDHLVSTPLLFAGFGSSSKPLPFSKIRPRECNLH